MHSYPMANHRIPYFLRRVKFFGGVSSDFHTELFGNDDPENPGSDSPRFKQIVDSQRLYRFLLLIHVMIKLQTIPTEKGEPSCQKYCF